MGSNLKEGWVEEPPLCDVAKGAEPVLPGVCRTV